MAIYEREEIYWYEFVFAGKRIRESAKTRSLSVAREVERARRRELERVLAGLPAERRENRVQSVSDAIRRYREAYAVNHRPSSITYLRKRLAWVERHLGRVLLGDLVEPAIIRYIRQRQTEGAAGRTINMEVGELSRAVGKPWSVLWPGIRKLEERKDVGRARAVEALEVAAQLRMAAASPHNSTHNLEKSTPETFADTSQLDELIGGPCRIRTYGQGIMSPLL